MVLLSLVLQKYMIDTVEIRKFYNLDKSYKI